VLDGDVIDGILRSLSTASTICNPQKEFHIVMIWPQHYLNSFDEGIKAGNILN
jgi:hypothetical protein